jgi:hypothetical protein
METSQDNPTTQGDDGNKKAAKHSRAFRIGREIVAATLWVYAFGKMFVLDIDVVLVERWLPFARPLLNFKAFIIGGTIAVLWIAMRQRFLPSLGYVLIYPLRLLFWYLPWGLFKRWTLLIVFAPAIYQGCRGIKRTYLLYVAASIAALLTMVATRPWILIPSVLVLHAFIAVHLWRALRRGYTANLFDDLTKLAGFAGKWIEGGHLDGTAERLDSIRAAQATPPAPDSPLAQQKPSPSLLYGARQGADYIADKTLEFAKSRKFDASLIASWCYTLILTAVTYAFIYKGLYALNAANFTVAHSASFGRCLLFSLQMLKIGVVESGLHAADTAALISASSETAAGIVVAVILGFTIFRARREGLNQDVERFAAGLRQIGASVEQRIVDVWKMTIVDCEIFLIERGEGAGVNGWRASRGLPPLPLPPKEPSVPADAAPLPDA